MKNAMKNAKLKITSVVILAILFYSVPVFSLSYPFYTITSDTLDNNYDVVVVGAGTGGVSAAIQAARMGAKVALLEETDWLGGQMIPTPNMDEGNIATRQDGIYKEFTDKVSKFYASQANNKPVATSYFSNNSVAFEPLIGEQALYELILETRGEALPGGLNPTLHLSLRTTVTSILTDANNPNKVTGVVIKIISNSGEITKTISSKILIDATEYGDILPLTPARYRVGNSKSDAKNLNSAIQDITYVGIIKKYPNGVELGLTLTEPPAGYNNDLQAIFASGVTNDLSNRPYYNKPWDCNYGAWDWKLSPWNWQEHNAYRGLPDYLPGPLAANPDNYTADCANYIRITKTTINHDNDYPSIYDAPDSLLTARYLEDLQHRKEVNYKAKFRTLQFMYYAQQVLGENLWSFSNVEGFDTAYNLDPLNNSSEIPDAIEKYFPPIPYVRESRRLLGLHTLTGEEILRVVPNGLPDIWGVTLMAKTNFPSALAIGYYFMDLHDSKKPADFEADTTDGELMTKFNNGVEKNRGGPFQVPFECFIPETIDGLLAAEKNISVSRLVNGATRLQPITMLTGQAAGAIAAIAVKKNIQPRSLDPILVQFELVNAGSHLSLTECSDVPRDNVLWPFIQLATTYKILNASFDTATNSWLFKSQERMFRAMTAVTFATTFKLSLQPAPSTPTFTDVPVTHWAYKEIEAVHKAGIMLPYSVDTYGRKSFNPGGQITRAQYAKMLIAALGVSLNGADERPIFVDVASTHTEFKQIQLLYQLSLTTGMRSDNTGKYFVPNDYLTRGQAAGFLIRSLMLRANQTDLSLPSRPAVTDEGQYTSKNNQLYAGWSAADLESGIAEYQYKITQDSTTGTVIKGWTSTGTYNYITAGGLNLANGKTYYFAVRAKNGAGLWSESGYSNGITVQQVSSISYKTISLAWDGTKYAGSFDWEYTQGQQKFYKFTRPPAATHGIQLWLAGRNTVNSDALISNRDYGSASNALSKYYEMYPIRFSSYNGYLAGDGATYWFTFSASPTSECIIMKPPFYDSNYYIEVVDRSYGSSRYRISVYCW